MELTLEERFEWLKANKPANWNGDKEFITWEDAVKNIKQDMYSFSFNHPFYCGGTRNTDDEERHLLLDDLGVPREIKN